ncbi:hypothetical protein DPMN_164780 [Dreissena polymorpha]|uniref:Uncharacterized protein n=1 Tax=Dreissena polymorpha TaxID=45954 RepID=A0A9D4EUU9_DREPO|nr:hypothetical protein DPMN_164780 [Dreissena polymorpha]
MIRGRIMRRNQVFYIAEEFRSPGKGANTVVSYLHHYFQCYGAGLVNSVEKSSRNEHNLPHIVDDNFDFHDWRLCLIKCFVPLKGLLRSQVTKDSTFPLLNVERPGKATKKRKE